ncbi:hypothetical protein AVEN_194032-1 [Araneus ventricosus]|uniref:Uncharacterized protein n=1 Tax=Araneus ventricosus TaxID=182803 RepID=A0A4Y2DKX9_ARAVE|nr:hypothetical protein AVEN_194032-1 [Araneus ventricosus]
MSRGSEPDITALRSQIAILVCSNLLLQICKLAASLIRKECKLGTSYCKRGSHHRSNLPQACCVKLIANYSKRREHRQTSDSNPRQPTLSPDALATQPAEL